MRELEQCKKERSILKKIILRKDMARRVKQCDGKISNLLQTFEVSRWFKFFVRFTGINHRMQVALAIDARLEQVKVNKNSRRYRT
jgi:hypothetical protein